jgi:hypothetical protein
MVLPRKRKIGRPPDKPPRSAERRLGLVSYLRIGAALAAVLGALALLAPAAPAKKLPKAKFELSVTGSQTTSFSKNEPNCVGSGREEVSFATPQPIKVTVVKVKAEGQTAPFFNFGPVPPNGFGDPTFDVNAVVHRAQNWTATAECTFLDMRSCDTSAPAAWQLRIFGDFFEANTVVIEDAGSGEDPLAGSCPEPEALGTYFPRLLSYDEVAREYLVKGPLSTKALFRKKKGKKGKKGKGKKQFTSHGQGSQHVDFFDEITDTNTNWTVTLKRIR